MRTMQDSEPYGRCPICRLPIVPSRIENEAVCDSGHRFRYEQVGRTGAARRRVHRQRRRVESRPHRLPDTTADQLVRRFARQARQDHDERQEHYRPTSKRSHPRLHAEGAIPARLVHVRRGQPRGSHLPRLAAPTFSPVAPRAPATGASTQRRKPCAVLSSLLAAPGHAMQ